MDQMTIRAGDQFVTLGLGRELFAIPVEAVLEIIDLREMFRVPDAPNYLAGLIDLRRRSVPVIDLRIKLGLAPAAPTESTRIVVLEIPASGRQLVIGLIADQVFEVASLDGDKLESPPDIGTRWRSDYILGVGRHSETFVVIFDLQRLFSSDDTALLGKSSHSSTDCSLAAA